jgi:beta-glucuronidase
MDMRSCRAGIVVVMTLIVKGVVAPSYGDDVLTATRRWERELEIAEGTRPATLALDLSGEWVFRTDPQNTGQRERWYDPTPVEAASWTPFRVPGVWNEGQSVSEWANYNGYGWFRRTFDLPNDWFGGYLRLRFLAVYLIADVWLNGRDLGVHRGGYTSFAFDVSNLIRPTGNVLVVRADNTPRPEQAPHHSIDWWNAGGLSREVYLERLETPSLDRFEVRTHLKPPTAAIRIRFAHGTPRDVRVTIVDATHDHSVGFELDRSILALRQSSFLELEFAVPVPDAQLWSPESPTLYYARIEWRGESEFWNAAWERFGFRELKAVGSQLILNGAPVWLQGMAFHHDYPGMGSAGTYEAMRNDLLWSKRLHCNFVRLGHYPFHPDALDMCDELGLLVWSEIPVWQNAPDVLADARFNADWVMPQLGEMVDQLGNHPSVVIWSVGNEFSQAWLSRGQREDDRIIDYVKRTTAFLRAKDPSRLVSYASAASTGVGTWEYLDVIGKPFHYGWFHSANVYDVRREVDLVHAAMPDKPILCVELAGMSYVGKHASYGADERHSLEYHDKLLRVDLQSLMSRRAFVAGVTVWTLRDLRGGREIGTYGLFTRDGTPKYLYDTVKTLYANAPRVIIHEEKTRFRPGETLRLRIETFSEAPSSLPYTVEWHILSKRGTVASERWNAVTDAFVKPVGEVAWRIPNDTEGACVFVALLRDSEGRVVSTNDFPFDVQREDGSGEIPVIVWVDPKRPGVTVTVDGWYPKVTDELGKVAFVLPARTYRIAFRNVDGVEIEPTVTTTPGTETTVSE